MAQTQAIEFVTPAMRMVQGDALTPQTKDNKGNPLTVKTGPNKGQPTQRYFIAGAIPKTVLDNRPGSPTAGQRVANWEFAELYAKFHQAGRQGYPNCFDAQGNITHPRFTLKIMDGDGVDSDGKPNNTKPGFAGHWVVKFSSSFLPRVVDAQGNPITDADAVKRGYYIRVFGNCAANIGSDVPGIYVNHSGIQLIGYGEPISSGPDVASIFAKAAPLGYTPEGMSSTPPVPAAGLPPLPGAPIPGAAAPGALPGMAGMPMPGAAPVAGPGMLPPMPGAAAPLPMPGGAAPLPMPAAPAAATPLPQLPPVAAPAPTPPAQQFQMTAAAQGFTREQFIAQGHTDDTLIQQGFMVRVAAAPAPVASALPQPPAALTPPGLPPRNDAFVTAVAAPQFQMTAAAQGFTREQYHAQGHTDNALIQHGLMIRVA